MLKGLMFNSHYFVEVMPAKASGYRLSRRLEIYTPYCHQPAEKFSKCLDKEASGKEDTHWTVNILL